MQLKCTRLNSKYSAMKFEFVRISCLDGNGDPSLFPGFHFSSKPKAKRFPKLFFFVFIASHSNEHTYRTWRAALMSCRLAVYPLQVNSFKVNYRLATINVRCLARDGGV